MKKILARYHRGIYFPETFEEDIGKLFKIIGKRNWLWGFHAVKKLLETIDKSTARKIISFVYGFTPKSDMVFEVYYSNQGIEKFCIRTSLDNKLDLILVISKEKTIVTLYVNGKNYNHPDLDESLYQKKGV